MKKALFILFSITLLLGAVETVKATPITFTGSSGDLGASVNFAVDGSGNLIVTLTNTSTADVLIPSEVLTAVFFDISGNPSLTPVSALLNTGSVVFFGSDGGGNVGGEWAYAFGLSGAPGGATEGISSAGFGLFGAGNFGGPNLEGPAALNGLNYGLTSAGDNLSTGNAQVTGNVPLIQNSVVFTLGGLPDGFDPGAAITNVSFQYGTRLTDPNVTVPEPGILILLGIAMSAVGLAARCFRRFKC